MILLRLISWPYVRQHLLRTALTSAGIVLGVAVFVGTQTANETVVAGFETTVDRIAGKTQLQVTAGEAGFGEEVLEAVQSAPGVRVAVPVIEVAVDSNMTGEGNLLVLGVDMTGDRSLRDYDLEHDADEETIDDPLIFIAQPDSLIVSKAFAARHHISIGDSLPLGTVDGQRLFKVRGLVRASELASAFGGNIAIMDIYAAQHMFGRGRTFDRIDVALAEGVLLAQAQRDIQSLVGPGFDVRPPSGRGQQFESLLASYSLTVGISSAFALFIGMFIIHSSFATAVTQRRREIGILRSLGATRGQIRWLFLGESLVIGGVGSVLGLVVGLSLAHVIASGMAALIGDVYGIGQTIDGLTISPRIAVIALVTGVVTSVAAAAIPARQASRLNPIETLRRGREHLLSAREGRWRLVAAAGCAVTSVACLASGSHSRPVFYLGYFTAMTAALLLGPVLTLGLAVAARPVLQWLRPVEGALAADSLIQAPRRVSASVVALMFSLALAVAFQGIGLANYRSMADWMESVLNPDLFVSPSQNMDARATRFPAAMAAEIAAVPGIARVQAVRSTRTTVRGTAVMLTALEMNSVAETVTLPPVAGDQRGMYREAAAGGGLIVSDNFAQLHDLALGQVLEIAAPYGTIRLPIVGVVTDYSDLQGTILIDRSMFVRHWHDDSVNLFRVYATPGADIGEIRSALRDRLAGHRQLFVLTNAELKAYIMGILGQWFRLTSFQLAVAVFVAILGIANTVTVSVTDRRRELGVLRAIGAGHWQVRRAIWMEAIVVGGFGLVLGAALGALNLSYLLEIVQRDVSGIRLPYAFPSATVLSLVPLIGGAALLAALWPAESAIRSPLVEALEYE